MVRETGNGVPPASAGPRETVAALYEQRAVELIRLAFVMLGDHAAAEDVVHEAFCGLFRRWRGLDDPAKALPYVRSAVLNGCRSALRQRRRRGDHRGDWDEASLDWPEPAETPEARVLLAEDSRRVLAALQRLPARQREALLLRYYLDLAPAEIAVTMGVSPGTVKSTTARGLAALGRLIQEPA